MDPAFGFPWWFWASVIFTWGLMGLLTDESNDPSESLEQSESKKQIVVRVKVINEERSKEA